MADHYDFTGWATRNNLRCSDGRTILQDAFKHNDGQTVPLVWNHMHDGAENVLGKVLLHNVEGGVRCYGSFNDTPWGRHAKEAVLHGDLTALSICANHLKQNGGDVLHGDIKEVSLVLAGANPGAYIDSFVNHGEYSDDEAIIYTDEVLEIELEHSDDEKEEDKKEQEKENKMAEEAKKSDQAEENSEETIKDIFDTLNEKQQNAVYAVIGMALEDGNNKDSDEEEEEMKHNLFDSYDNENDDVLTHAEMTDIINDGKRYGSLKESMLQHGIDDIEYLFPDAKSLNNPPEFIKRNDNWVSKVMNGVHHTPFARIKSMFADLREDEARAKGYIKGNLKKEEVFSLLKRETAPTTIYKKQKMHRDDVVDITDFDVIAWLKTEMRMMLDEEIARAILIGDGRLASSDDKINEQCIRPIAFDDALFTIQAEVKAGADSAETANNFIDTVIRSRKEYKGSGNPSLFTTEDQVTECLLLKDSIGHRLYKTMEELATTLRVKEIITVEAMEGQKGKNGGVLAGVLVNLNDYNVGADKGGAINMFDDFDIDYNAQKYLIETRCSGALTKPFSAIAFEVKANG